MPHTLYRFIKQDREAVRENLSRALRNAGLLTFALIGAIGLCFGIFALFP